MGCNQVEENNSIYSVFRSPLTNTYAKSFTVESFTIVKGSERSYLAHNCKHNSSFT